MTSILIWERDNGRPGYTIIDNTKIRVPGTSVNHKVLIEKYITVSEPIN
jgi:hypothetical protein